MRFVLAVRVAVAVLPFAVFATISLECVKVTAAALVGSRCEQKQRRKYAMI